MKKIDMLDQGLTILGYLAATFILVISVVAIILAVIKMHKSGLTTAQPQLQQAEGELKLMLDAAPSDRNFVESDTSSTSESK